MVWSLLYDSRIFTHLYHSCTRFITSFRRRPPKNLDAAGMAVQSLLRDVESNLEKEKHTLDEHARAVKISLSPYEVDQKMEWVENYICRELYDRYVLFHISVAYLCLFHLTASLVCLHPPVATISFMTRHSSHALRHLTYSILIWLTLGLL
jgi:hypothetical protein